MLAVVVAATPAAAFASAAPPLAQPQHTRQPQMQLSRPLPGAQQPRVKQQLLLTPGGWAPADLQLQRRLLRRLTPGQQSASEHQHSLAAGWARLLAAAGLPRLHAAAAAACWLAQAVWRRWRCWPLWLAAAGGQPAAEPQAVPAEPAVPALLAVRHGAAAAERSS